MPAPPDPPGPGPRPAGRRDRWADLRLRIVSACVLAPLGLACLWLGGAPWAVLLVAITAGLVLEWWHLARLLPRRLGGVRPAGLLLVLLAALALVWLRRDPHAGRGDVLFLVLVVWASDIGAYLCGRCLGGPRLAPSISPGKTWSGAAGGLLAAAAAGLAVAHGAWPAAAAALLLGAVAQGGDLLESAVKRAAGVKDSGRLIPGHGGLLDRLDGMLAAAPVAALLALLAGRGVVFWQ